MSPQPPFRVVLAALAAVPEYEATLPLACLKAFALSQPGLGPKRLRVDIRQWLMGSAAPDAMVREILEDRPALVGLSCYLWNIAAVGDLVKKLRQAAPDLKIVLGGPEVWLDPAGLLRTLPVDFIVLGEGEEPFAELVRRLLGERDPGDVPGLALRVGGKPVVNPPGPPVEPLDLIPSPYIDGTLRFEDPAFRGGVLETSRGCPFHCAYCAWLGERGGVRYFSEPRIREVIRALARLAPGRIFFVADSDLFMNRARAKRVLRILREEDPGAGLRFTFETNLEYFDDELARLSDRAGFHFRAGLQSTNPAALAAANRRCDLERFRRGFAHLQRRAPRAAVAIELILGMPGDTPDGFRRSLDWMLDLGSDDCFVYQLMVFPGTGYARDAARYGLRFEAEAPHLVLAHAAFSEAEILRARELLQRLSFLLSLRPVRRLLEHLRRKDPEGPGLSALAASLAETVSAGGAYPVAESIARWEALRPHGVFPLTQEWPEDIDSAVRRAALLPSVMDWLRSRRPASAGGAAFLRAAWSRALWESECRCASVAGLLRRERERASGLGPSLLVCWARDWRLHERMGGIGGMVLLSEDGHPPDSLRDGSQPVREILFLGRGPAEVIHPSRWGGGYGWVVLANAFSYLPDPEKSGWLTGLRRRCRPGARLLILDDFLGRAPYSVESFAAARAGGAEALRAALPRCGWALDGAPESAARREGVEWLSVRATAV